MTWHDPRLLEHQKSLQVVLDPIIFQIKDGERVAVLLLDVEGAFATEKDEFAAGLFGLATSLGFTIWNLPDRFEAGKMGALSCYVQHAAQAHAQEEAPPRISG